ncbi:MAG: adenylate kinase [Ruminococcaceae bacterium]|nr:adenylate kinase [Oscillospiraceae bacterium]
MDKIIVIGCPGSGKSTFARALHKITGIPLYHLDMMYWKPDRTTVPKAEFREHLRAVLETERWIIDGNYGSTMEMRMACADTVFFLDYETDVCLDGIRERRGKPRPDMPWVEEGDDGEFLDFIRGYNDTDRPKVMNLLDLYSDKTIHIFCNRKEADEFLSALA